jgi:hypothetical protein
LRQQIERAENKTPTTEELFVENDADQQAMIDGVLKETG